jgi:hypothetical protein
MWTQVSRHPRKQEACLSSRQESSTRTPPRMLSMQSLPRIHIVVGGTEPVTVDTEEFRYAYRCKHCGHEWSEEHTEKHVEKPTTPEDDGRVTGTS